MRNKPFNICIYRAQPLLFIKVFLEYIGVVVNQVYTIVNHQGYTIKGVELFPCTDVQEHNPSISLFSLRVELFPCTRTQPPIYYTVIFFEI